MDDSIYTLKRYKKQKKKSFKFLYLIILILVLMITYKTDKSIFTNNFNFAKLNKLYESIFGSVIPLPTNNEESVFNEKLEYNNASKYKEGAKLSVKRNSPIPARVSGLVVFIGEKEGYGNTVIIQQVDGIDAWYGNINNVNCKLYDYVSKGTIIGDTVDNNLYLVYKKEGTNLNYEEYIKS